MNHNQVAIYARVSSDQQAEAGTISSQIAALQERVEKDGYPLRACYAKTSITMDLLE